MRQRAERLAHSHNTHSPYNLPELGKQRASKAHRAGVAARFPAPAVPQRLEVDLALLDSDDPRLNEVELSIVRLAK
jgi:hypothetical protein